MAYKSMADIRAKNRAEGYRFFSRANMHFFTSRVVSAVYGGYYFIIEDSLKHSNGSIDTTYSVCKAEDNGYVDYVWEHKDYRDCAEARGAARELAQQQKPLVEEEGATS